VQNADHGLTPFDGQPDWMRRPRAKRLREAPPGDDRPTARTKRGLLRSEIAMKPDLISTLCRDQTRERLGLRGDDAELDALIDGVVETTVEVVLEVVHALSHEAGSVFMVPPAVSVIRGDGGEPVEFQGCGEVLRKGRAGDQWEIMRVLVDNAGKPLSVRQVQEAVDGERVAVREKVIRTRIAELARRFPGSIVAENQSGQRHKQYCFVATLEEAPSPN